MVLEGEPSVEGTIQAPSPISSLAYGPCSHFFAGSDDGSLRVFHRSNTKVLKAISGLGSEISSVASLPTSGTEIGDIWLACGRRILLFRMDSPKMILSLADATVTLDLGHDNDDVLNEIALSSNRRHLAFSQDTGVVGVVDLGTMKVSKMRGKHNSICGSVKFIPNRPNELVSGGYDQALLHFDFLQGKILSRCDLAAFPFAGGMSLSPPFVMSTSLSSTGSMVAGTADGRLWFGLGGDRGSGSRSNNKKKSGKWGGLRGVDEFFIKVAEGPVVAVTFTDPMTLIFCTLLGKITQCHIARDEAEHTIDLENLWTKDTVNVAKVNTLIVDHQSIIIGGLGKEGKGVIEIWNRNMID